MSDLRKAILSKRDKLSSNQIYLKSKIIVDLLKQIPEFNNSKFPLIYVSFRSEVFTHELIKERLNLKNKVVVPLTISSEKKIIPYELIDFSRLKKGYFGIPEPDPSIEKPFSPIDIDCVIVPGSVFDRKGGRYGYGGGFYDRFFTECPKAIKIALAFDLQIKDFIPLKEHDIKMDIIVTEKEIITN